MKYLTVAIGISVFLGACSAEVPGVECAMETLCQTPGGDLRIHVQRGTNHGFTLTLEGEPSTTIREAYIEGINMHMGRFPLSVEPGEGRVIIRGIIPVCTLGDDMRWRVVMNTARYQIRAEMP